MWIFKKRWSCSHSSNGGQCYLTFCLMRCAGKWAGLVQRLRSLNEDTAQEQLCVDAYMFLWWSDAFKKRLKESSLFRSWKMDWLLPKEFNAPWPACPLFLAESQSWGWLKGSPLPLQTLSECPQRIPRRMPSPLSSVSGIQHCRKMLWRVEAEGGGGEIVKSLAGKLWTKGCLGAANRRHAFRRHAQAEKRRSFLSSSVLGQMTHQSRINRWMCARVPTCSYMLGWNQISSSCYEATYFRWNITSVGAAL